jgi:hypothetical protein
VWWLQRYVRERWSESYNSSSSRGTQYDERNSRSSQEDQEVGLGQEYQKEVRVGQEDLIHIVACAFITPFPSRLVFENWSIGDRG